jgi:hypothetical protein
MLATQRRESDAAAGEAQNQGITEPQMNTDIHREKIESGPSVFIF